MHHEIERKFLIRKMPNLRGIKKIPQERYFLQRSDLFEEGMKRKGGVYLYETKFMLSKDEKTREKVVIDEEEFESKKKEGTPVIVRDSYELTKSSPRVSIKKYKGIYSGLELAEVEFDSVEEMEDFVPLDWMGDEVTDTKLGKDARLVDLSKENFKILLNEVIESGSGYSSSDLL